MSMQNCGMNSRNSSKEKKSSNDQVKQPIRSLGDWSEFLSSSGKIYFYNQKTEKTQWEKPDEWEWLIQEEKKNSEKNYYPKDYKNNNPGSLDNRYRNKYDQFDSSNNSKSMRYSDNYKNYSRDYHQNDYSMNNNMSFRNNNSYNTGGYMNEGHNRMYQNNNNMQTSGGLGMPSGYDNGYNSGHYRQFGPGYGNEQSMGNQKHGNGFNRDGMPNSNKPYSSYQKHHTSRYDNYNEPDSGYSNMNNMYNNSSNSNNYFNNNNNNTTNSLKYHSSEYEMREKYKSLPCGSHSGEAHYQENFYNSDNMKGNENCNSANANNNNNSRSYSRSKSSSNRSRSRSRSTSNDKTRSSSNSSHNSQSRSKSTKKNSHKRLKKSDGGRGEQRSGNHRSDSQKNSSPNFQRYGNDGTSTGSTKSRSADLSYKSDQNKSKKSNGIDETVRNSEAEPKNIEDSKTKSDHHSSSQDSTSKQSENDQRKDTEKPEAMNTCDEKDLKSAIKQAPSSNSDHNHHHHQHTKPLHAQSSVEPILESTMDDVNRYYRPELLSKFTDIDLYQNVRVVNSQVITKHLNITSMGVELKKFRALVRLKEIKKTLNEQRLIFLQNQMKEIEELLN